MRSIIGNHVAFVREGRAGPDVMVMDSSEELQWQMIEKALRVGDSKENLKMKPLTRKAAAVQGALVAFLAPKLAHDEKVDFTNILASVTAENYDSRRPELLRSVSRLIEGKLAQDASAEGLSTLLEALSGVKPMEGKDDEGMATAPNAGLPVKPVRPTGEGEGSGARMMDRGSDAEDPRAETGEDPGMGTGQGEEDPDQGGEMSPAEQIKAWFQQNLTPEQCQAFEQFMATLKGGMGGGEEEAPGLDEEPDTLGTEEAKGPKAGIGQVAEQPKDGAYGKDKRSMKPAMDEATVRKTVDAAVLAEREVNRLTREAYNFVEPWVGKIKMALDTAEAVHRQALKMRNVDVSKIKDPAALPIVLSQLCKIGEEGKRVRLASMAADAAPEDYDSKWGLDAVKIRRVA